ncbi:MAG: DUF2569 domain-containing protein [Betaproteobacteria bacterium]|nr:DUF2569 domain-containing protein [Betaproteobacteria bacterium]
MMDASQNPYQPPQSPLETAENAELKGLGGWLILVGFGLIVTVIMLPLAVLGIVYLAQGSPGAMKTPYVIFTIIGYLAWAGLAGFSLYLFFTKSRRFPRFFIGYTLFGLFVCVADAFLFRFAPAGLLDTAESGDVTRQLFQQLFYTVIWVTYMQRSKRVKNTFVE